MEFDRKSPVVVGTATSGDDHRDMHLGERIKTFRKQRLLTIAQLAEKAGLHHETVIRAEKSPDLKNLQPAKVEAILKALKVKPSAFFESETNDGIPVFEQIPASPPQFVGEAVQSANQWIPRHMATDVGITDPRAYAVKVHGDSMAPTYSHGDMVFARPVDQDRDIIESGRVYIVWLDEHHDGGGTLKRVVVRRDGKWLLVPDNAKFEIIPISPEAITKMDLVLGRFRPDAGIPADLEKKLKSRRSAE